jgi:hypothetical protein
MTPERRTGDDSPFLIKYWQVIVSTAFVIFSTGIWISKSNAYDIRLCKTEAVCEKVAPIQKDVRWIKENMAKQWGLVIPKDE